LSEVDLVDSGEVLKPGPLEAVPARPWRSLGLASLGYLLLSFYYCSSLWTAQPRHGTVTPIFYGDAPFFIWSLEWMVHAISHGLNPFWSGALFPPTGVNLLTNTGVPLIGFVLAPLTWLLGPVLSMNVALTLSPVLSALAMFVLLRRLVAWSPAAFIGGLFYGFCPFIMGSLLFGQLHQTMLVFPPLILILLDEILLRERGRPVRLGILLGLCIAGQFLIGTEILLMMSVVSAVVLILLILFAAFARELSAARIRRAVISLGTAAGTALLLLAYPLWFALAGPAHLGGPIWPRNVSLGGLASLTQLVFEPKPLEPVGLSFSFIGFGVIVVTLLGLLLWRRDRRLWFFGLVVMVAIILSLGEKIDVWTPWKLVAGLPLLENIYPQRFVLFAVLALAVILGLVVDHAKGALAVHLASRSPAKKDSPSVAGSVVRRWTPAVLALLLGSLAIIPVSLYLERELPVKEQAIHLPRWFQVDAPKIPEHQVLLVLPMIVAWDESPMSWQALQHLRWTLVQGAGPAADPSRAGVARAGYELLYIMSNPVATLRGSVIEHLGPLDFQAVRQAMNHWGVEKVVFPSDSFISLNTPQPTALVGLITAATGVRPQVQDRAWVWSGIKEAGPPASLSRAQFTKCVTTQPSLSFTGGPDVSSCVLDTRH